jgi:hypothetical protein
MAFASAVCGKHGEVRQKIMVVFKIPDISHIISLPE